MKYVETSPQSRDSIKSCLKTIDKHGHLHLASGSYFEDIIINIPVKLTGEPDTIIYGKIHVTPDTQTVSIDGITVSSETPLEIELARDVTVKNCKLIFMDTAVRVSGVNVSIESCVFEQQGGYNPYNVIVIGKAFDINIISNTHVKRDSYIDTFITTTSEPLSGTLRVQTNNIDIKNGHPGNFIVLRLEKQGNQRFRFDVTNNKFITSQNSPGGFVIVNSRNPLLTNTILETNPPSKICSNEVIHPVMGWLYMDTSSEPIKDKIYVNIHDNIFSGTRVPKPLYNTINDVMVLPVGGGDLCHWSKFVNTIAESDVSSNPPIEKFENEVINHSESSTTVLFAMLFAFFVVLVVVNIAKKF